MHFENTIASLKEKLKGPLPGLASHKKFMFANRLQLSLQVPDDVKNSAVLILFFPIEGNPFFPLILRPEYDGRHGGQMALPGGKAEFLDESLVRTALREAQEEVGIKALDVNVLGHLTDVYVPVSNFLIRPVVGFVDYQPDFFPDAREVAKIYLTNLQDILTEKNVIHRNMYFAQMQVSVPGYQIQDQWVWGATALILSELSDILTLS